MAWTTGKPVMDYFMTRDETYIYWWNLYLFDVYCAKKDGDRKKYDEALNVVNKFEAHIQEKRPFILKQLSKPVEWS